MKKDLKNALPLKKRSCFNCRFANVISKVFGEVYCKRYKDCPQGLYQIAVRDMQKEGKCRFWEYKEESEER